MDFGIVKCNKNDNIYAKALSIATELLRISKKYNPTVVSIEGLAFGMRGSATRDLAGLQFVIYNELARHGLTVKVIAPLTVKKFATGSGKAEKSKMISCLPKDVRKKFDDLGVKKTTGLADMADAYWIAQATFNEMK